MNTNTPLDRLQKIISCSRLEGNALSLPGSRRRQRGALQDPSGSRMKRAALALMLPAIGLGALHAGDTTYEANSDYSYVGGTRMQTAGNLAEQSNQAHFAVSTQIPSGQLLRIGADWQRYSFSAVPQTAHLPNTLQSVNLTLGADVELWGWLFRIEAQPGFYGNFQQFDGKGFNLPFIVGGMYLVNSDLQWVAGVSVNVERNVPVLPAAGVRWKFAKDWVLNAVLPRPRLEYTLTESATLYAGGDFKLGTYRMDGSFGNDHGNPHLNNALIDYTEIRVGGGAEVKAGSSVKIDLETGCMVYRQFDFHRANIAISNDSAAAYGQIVVSCSF